MDMECTVVILMGVSGCGKSSVGQKLSAMKGWPFYDGDDFHSAENREKMKNGNPLTDQDRLPWLKSINQLIIHSQTNCIVACSALKKSYRKILSEKCDLANGKNCATFFLLDLNYATAAKRMSQRQGHFFKINLLRNQFDALERFDHTETGYRTIVVDTEQMNVQHAAEFIGQKI